MTFLMPLLGSSATNVSLRNLLPVWSFRVLSTPARNPAATQSASARIGGPAAASAERPGNLSARRASKPASVTGPRASAKASRVSFEYDAPNAGIYIDGDFAGNAPSTAATLPGSRQIRVESGRSKPWTRTPTSTAGNKVSMHATPAKK